MIYRRQFSHCQTGVKINLEPESLNIFSSMATHQAIYYRRTVNREEYLITVKISTIESLYPNQLRVIEYDIAANEYQCFSELKDNEICSVMGYFVNTTDNKLYVFTAVRNNEQIYTRFICDLTTAKWEKKKKIKEFHVPSSPIFVEFSFAMHLVKYAINQA